LRHDSSGLIGFTALRAWSASRPLRAWSASRPCGP